MYYMTSKRTNEDGYWEECKAKTLTGAKREATKAYGAGYNDAVLLVGMGDEATEPRYVVAQKPNGPGGKWASLAW